MKCPVCRARYQTGQQALCRRCGADLTMLIQLHDRALWHYRRAIELLRAQDYPAAQAQLQQAIALNSRESAFYALDGQLWALQGQFQPAIAAWQQARQLNPKEPIAVECLQRFAALAH